MLFKGRHSLLWDTVDQKQFFPFKSIRKSTSLAEYRTLSKRPVPQDSGFLKQRHLLRTLAKVC